MAGFSVGAISDLLEIGCPVSLVASPIDDPCLEIPCIPRANPFVSTKLSKDLLPHSLSFF